MAKTAKVMLDKERTLKYPVFSLIRLQKEHGIKLTDLSDEKKAQDLEVIVALIWAGLIHEDKELTLEDVGNMIDLSDLTDLSTVMADVLGNATKKD